MFIALDVPYLLLGPVAGLAVDKYGTKPAAVFGFGYLVPALVLLWLAHASGENQIILYSALLAHYGVGMAVIGSPALSKPQMWFRNMTRRTQVFFSENKDHIHHCTVSILRIFFCAGLTSGPIVGGALRNSIGYGNMNTVTAVISDLITALSFSFIGGKLKFFSIKMR
jgi:MFS family permease